MDIRIGIINSAREIALETAQSEQEINDAVTTALADGTPLVLRDTKGRAAIVAPQALAFVEIDTEQAPRVGFLG